MCLMDAVIIGNRSAGRAGNEDRLKRCAAILREHGVEAEVWATEYPQHATELATRAGERLVIAAGGDGTVNEVVNGISGDATLAVLPLGTANVLARELEMPRKTEDVCRRIATGQTIRIDLGIATSRDGTERRFTCMAGIGFDANVVKEVNPGLKKRLKSAAFPLAAFKVYLDSDLPTLHLHHEDEVYKTQFAVVANSHYYGGEFQMLREGSLTSGELEVVLIERVSLLLRPDLMARILSRKPLTGSMKSFSTREFTARAPGAHVPVQLDGEVWGRLPMTFRVAPAALKVIR